MKKTAGITFHNRFDIEVIDKITGQVKQKAQAENIVLDQMYSRLCALNTYFVNIHFGTGTGTPTPERTTLFTHLGTKAATTEEIIKAYPVSKWTRYIRLEPAEYVGSTITEVGIAFGSTNTNLVTHAMIKDSEGNPLSIDKTDLDVVVIYATVFITLSNSDHLVFSNMPTNNFLLNRLFHEGGESATLQVGSSSGALDSSKNSCDCMLFSIGMTAVSDVSNRKRRWTRRLEVTQANHNIQELGLHYALRVMLGNTPTWGDYQVSDIPLTLLAGETNKFAVYHPRPQDLTLRVDGVLTSNYQLTQHTLDYPGLSLQNVCENLVGSGSTFANIDSFNDEVYQCTATNYFSFGSSSSSSPAIATMDVKEEFREMLLGATFEARINASYRTSTIYFEVSYDGETFVSLGSLYAGSGAVQGKSSPITQLPLKLRFRGHGSTYSSGELFWVRLIPAPPVVIEVLNPINESTSVTASYRVNSVPKNDNYVLDVVFEVQYGEGV